MFSRPSRSMMFDYRGEEGAFNINLNYLSSLILKPSGCIFYDVIIA